jgi:hypothetical protein
MIKFLHDRYKADAQNAQKRNIEDDLPPLKEKISAILEANETQVNGGCLKRHRQPLLKTGKV